MCGLMPAEQVAKLLSLCAILSLPVARTVEKFIAVPVLAERGHVVWLLDC